MLEGREVPDHGDDRVAHRLRDLVRRAERGRHEVRQVDDSLDDGAALGGIAIEQWLGPMTADGEVELPDEIPRVLEPRIHALATERAMNVGGIAGDEDAADAHLVHLAVMNT